VTPTFPLSAVTTAIPKSRSPPRTPSSKKIKAHFQTLAPPRGGRGTVFPRRFFFRGFFPSPHIIVVSPCAHRDTGKISLTPRLMISPPPAKPRLPYEDQAVPRGLEQCPPPRGPGFLHSCTDHVWSLWEKVPPGWRIPCPTRSSPFFFPPPLDQDWARKGSCLANFGGPPWVTPGILLRFFMGLYW